MPTRKAAIAAIVVITILLTAAWALAQGKGHIQLTSTAEQEKEVFNEEGKKELRRLPAAKVVPGDEIIFTTNYENVSPENAENVVITNPIPKHMTYKAHSAAGAGTRITFSADGGKTYDLPANLFTYDSSGRQFPAQVQDYTHIRWTFEKPLPSGATGEVSFRAILE